MERDTQTNIGLEDKSESPNPPPAQFNATLDAARPVEPLVTNQTRQRPHPSVRRFLKGRNGKLGLLAAVLVATLLSAAFGGVLLGLHDAIRAQRATESSADAPVVNQTVINQKAEEASKASIPARPLKVSDNIPRLSRLLSTQPLSVAPARPDLAQLGDKPVARKVGVIIFGHKEDRRKGEVRRRHGDKDDDQ